MAQFPPKGTRAIMASEQQIEANRLNTQLSTGPRTPEGKAAVRFNALRHGLTAKHAVATTEQEAEFQEIKQSFEDHYQPAGPTETLLVQQIVMAAWRLGRLRGLGTGIFNMLLEEEQSGLRRLNKPSRHDQHAFVLLRDARDVGALTTLARYETRTERSFYRALHELERLQAARRTPPDQTNPNSPSDEPQTAEPQDPPLPLSPCPPVTMSPCPPLSLSPSPAERVARMDSFPDYAGDCPI